jgi:small nuclear ribonucleoprotein (snRNP)-like protein
MRRSDKRYFVFPIRSSLIGLIYCLIYFQIPIKKKVGDEFEGIIISIDEKEYYTQFVIKGDERVNCNYTGNLNLELGTKVKVSGQLKEYQDNTNIGLFNIRKFYYSKKIYHYLNIDNIQI